VVAEKFCFRRTLFCVQALSGNNNLTGAIIDSAAVDWIPEASRDLVGEGQVL
jgi:hypothetical protein